MNPGTLTPLGGFSPADPVYTVTVRFRGGWITIEVDDPARAEKAVGLLKQIVKDLG